MKAVNDHDVIVVGGGHNGMVAATYLAREGLDVMVLEASSKLGGMTATSTVITGAPDHRINTCAIDLFLTRAGTVVQDLDLASCGWRELDVDPCYAFFHPDGSSLAFWRDPVRTADEIRRFSHHDAEAYLELLRTLDAILDLALPVMLSHPRRIAPRTVAKLGRAGLKHRRALKQLPALLSGSAIQVIEERFSHPIVRDALAVWCSAAPPTVDGGALQLILMPAVHRFGIYRPVGGTGAIIDALAIALQRAGGSTRIGAVVDEIIVSGGRATGVRLATGEEMTARRAVISTADPRLTLTQMLPAGTLEPKMEARARHIPAYAGGFGHFKVDLAFSGQLRLDRYERQRGDGVDMRIPSGLIGSFDAVVASSADAFAGRLPANVCMWTAIPTALDPSQAPPGQDTLYLFPTPMPTEPDEPWDSYSDAAAKATVASAASVYEGLEDLEIGRYVESPHALAKRLRISSGCIYHVDFTLMRSGPLRPAPGFDGFRTPIDGLYLGGAGSHPGAGVSGIPGQMAAREVLRAVKPG